MSTFRSENYQSPLANKIQSDAENQKQKSIDVVKSKSTTELKSLKLNQPSELILEKENQDFKFHRSISITFHFFSLSLSLSLFYLGVYTHRGKKNWFVRSFSILHVWTQWENFKALKSRHSLFNLQGKYYFISFKIVKLPQTQIADVLLKKHQHRQPHSVNRNQWSMFNGKIVFVYLWDFTILVDWN